MTVWPRHFPPQAGRTAAVSLLCFGVSFADGVALSASRFGYPDGVPLPTIRAFKRASDRAWFDGWREGALRTLASLQLGSLTALDAAREARRVTVEIPDPADLGHLQAAWAVARWLAATGATVVLDEKAITWRYAARLPGVELKVRDYVSFTAETEAVAPATRPVVHTRGLASFGRPDIVTLATPAEQVATSAILDELVTALADGWMPTPGHPVRPGLVLVPAPDNPVVKALNLLNEAWVLNDGGFPGIGPG